MGPSIVNLSSSEWFSMEGGKSTCLKSGGLRRCLQTQTSDPHTQACSGKPNSPREHWQKGTKNLMATRAGTR